MASLSSIYARGAVKAIRVDRTGGPEVLQLGDVPEPQPAPGEALVQLDAAWLNFIEIYFRQGLYPSPLPFIPGSEAAGVVAEVGEGVKDFRIGDRIVTSGGLFGTITRIGDASIQVQVANNVRVEMSRNAVVGYQGQEPVAPESQS